MKLSLLIFTISFPVLLLAQAGVPDSAFGLNGSVITHVHVVGEFQTLTSAIVTQPDGKILIAGTIITNAGNRLMLARYNKNGKLDKSFGKKGIDTPFLYKKPYIKAMALQPDGKIVVAGFTDSTGALGVVVLRFNSDGTNDSSFNNTGYVFTNFDDFVSIISVAIQTDGKIILGGTYQTVGRPSNVFLTIRYNSDGSLDTTFNHTGIANPITKYQTAAYGMKLLKNGKIVLCGVQGPSSFSSNSYALMKLNSDGSTDSSFGINGYVYGADNPAGPGGFTSFTNLDEESDGKLVACGLYEENDALATFRFNENGTFDSSYGNNGVAYTFFDSSGFTTAFAIEVQPNGKIIAGGYSDYLPDSNRFALARFNSNGTLDSSFGDQGDGKVNNSCQGFSSNAYAMSVAPDRIYLAGNADNGFAVAAYKLNDVTLPVKLISFTARPIDDKTLLHWETANEINIKGFIVERSGDAVNYTALLFVPPTIKNAGNGSYTFIDSLPLKGKNYYRLKLLDNDGSFTYSNTVLDIFQSISSNIKLYPNPCVDHLDFQIKQVNQGAASITVTDIKGVVLKTVNLNISSSTANGTIALQDLPSGIYFFLFYQDGERLNAVFRK